MDLADAVAKRSALSKAAYAQRVKRVLKTKQAQKQAASCAYSLRKTCKDVALKKGAASSR